MVLLVVAAVVATGAYAYTNAVGGVSPPLLGSASDPIDKYTLGTPVYNLNVSTPRNLDSVSFELTGATASTVVRVQLIAGGTWYACDESAAPTIACATTAPQVTAANANGETLIVVATG
ncbi:MAG: hypothetical protein WBQ14_03980 [Gaiellaceae bacterium]